MKSDGTIGKQREEGLWKLLDKALHGWVVTIILSRHPIGCAQNLFTSLYCYLNAAMSLTLTDHFFRT